MHGRGVQFLVLGQDLILWYAGPSGAQFRQLADLPERRCAWPGLHPRDLIRIVRMVNQMDG